ncbi:MAG: hypothetical protein PUA94_03010 [Bacteroidales bacterium]|nr:hypothetical protein [Bacteroidales bacterium]
MTPQEILASLSRLESELNEVASARLLVEQTANSYKEVQKELRSFVGEFQTVTNSLNTVARAFQDGKASLASEVAHSIEVLKAQLETLNNSFSNQCNSVVSRFVDSINNTSDQLKAKTADLTSDYATNNDTFKASIKELATLYASLLRASESVSSLKADISTLQSQLQSSQKEQNETLVKIASDLQASSASHTTILQQISSDLKSSQDAQDDDLANIKTTLYNIGSAQSQQKSNEEQIHNGVKNLRSYVESRLNNIDSKAEEISKTVKMARAMGIVNIIGIIILLILLFVR